MNYSRLTFTSYEERAAAGSRMKSDAQRLETLFRQLLDTGDINEPVSAAPFLRAITPRSLGFSFRSSAP